MYASNTPIYITFLRKISHSLTAKEYLADVGHKIVGNPLRILSN